MKQLTRHLGFTLLIVWVVLQMACGDELTAPPADSKSTGETTDSAASDGGEEDQGKKPGEIPPCNFQPPVGATCNPYPGCPGTGCTEGDICTLVVIGEKKRITCHTAGDVLFGGACNHESGPFCSEGLCVDSQCRSFCVDNEDCPNNAPCQPMKGVPGKPTVCGEDQTDCDPLNPVQSCEGGKACYWQNIGNDCLDVQKNGQQNSSCDCPNCCAPGLTCVFHDDTKICGQTCSLVEGGVPACQDACQGMAIKNLTTEMGVCVPGEGPVDPPPEPESCNILKQDCPGAGQGCYNTNKGDVCLIKGNKEAGTACESANECTPGTTCFAGKCYIVCDPNDPLHSECKTGVSAQCPPLSNSAGGYCDE
jgi:hypothetical protein